MKTKTKSKKLGTAAKLQVKTLKKVSVADLEKVVGGLIQTTGSMCYGTTCSTYC